MREGSTEVVNAGEQAPGGPQDLYDAFISYASENRRAAKRLQAYLEAFRGEWREPLKVYLDLTDMRGGHIGPELVQALASSRSLIVCASPAAVSKTLGAQGRGRLSAGPASRGCGHCLGRRA